MARATSSIISSLDCIWRWVRQAPKDLLHQACDEPAEGKATSDTSWRIANLRYFNPIGAHESGMLGERPQKAPNNLMPFLLQVAARKRERLDIFGGDYPTKDGSCVRDFIHVVDLAEGHVAALRYLDKNLGKISVNLGAGRGVSILEICDAFERSTGRHIPRRIVDRRPGDVAESWADVTKARQQLRWFARRDVDAMCRDASRWQSMFVEINKNEEAARPQPVLRQHFR